MKKIILVISFLYSMCCFAESGQNIISDKKPIRIGVILAEIGKSAKTNAYQYKTMQFAQEEVNASGGVLDRKIELIPIDNKSTALGSKIAAQKAVDLRVAAVIGPFWSSQAHGAAPILQKAKIPMIAPTATNPKVTLVGDYIFRACFVDTFQGEAMAHFVVNDLKAKSAVVLTNTGDHYSLGLSEFFQKNFRQLGGNVLWEGDYSDSDINFEMLLKKTKELKPDVVYVPGYIRDSGFIIKQARKMGIKATFLGGDGWNDLIYQYGEEYVDGSIFSNDWHVDVPREKSRDYVKRFEEEIGPVKTTPAAYDSVMLLVDAIKRAKSIDPQEIQKALATTKNFAGVTGNYTFDTNGDPIDKSVVILKFENGKAVYVKTINP